MYSAESAAHLDHEHPLAGVAGPSSGGAADGGPRAAAANRLRSGRISGRPSRRLLDDDAADGGASGASGGGVLSGEDAAERARLSRAVAQVCVCAGGKRGCMFTARMRTRVD